MLIYKKNIGEKNEGVKNRTKNSEETENNYQNNYRETLLFCYFLFQELGITACTLETPWLTD
jgi:hypothetical protein